MSHTLPRNTPGHGRTSNVQRPTLNVEPRSCPQAQLNSVGRWTFNVGRSTFGTRHSSLVRRSRRGLSLLEVLFAIFVAAVGLLGLAALLTVGGVHSAQTDQADRSAAVGRAFMREVENRGILRAHVWETNPATGLYEPVPNWLDATSTGPRPMSQILYATGQVVQLNVTDANGLPIGHLNPKRLDPFIIDPLLMSENGTTDPNAYFFPFKADVELTLRLPRMTLRGMYDPTNLPRSKEAAQRAFMSRDDVTTYHADRLSRPTLVPDDNRDGIADDKDGDGLPDPWASEGRYSYLVMVTPSELENPLPTLPPYARAVPLGQRRMFTVQVVVFQRRSLLVASSPPSERQVKALVVSPHSAILEPPRAVPVQNQPAYLDGLAANQWILLSSTLLPSNDPAYPAETSVIRPFHRWVRIASVGKSTTSAGHGEFHRPGLAFVYGATHGAVLAPQRGNHVERQPRQRRGDDRRWRGRRLRTNHRAGRPLDDGAVG